MAPIQAARVTRRNQLIHREHAVNIAHVRLLRLQTDGRDWELKLEPPVNSVLPIARDRLASLRAALGEH